MILLPFIGWLKRTACWPSWRTDSTLWREPTCTASRTSLTSTLGSLLPTSPLCSTSSETTSSPVCCVLQRAFCARWPLYIEKAELTSSSTGVQWHWHTFPLLPDGWGMLHLWGSLPQVRQLTQLHGKINTNLISNNMLYIGWFTV